MESINTEPQNPAGEDTSAPPPPAAVVMDPWLLLAASMGDCEALKTLLNWGDAPVWPTALAPQVVVEVPVDEDALDNLSTTNGILDVQKQPAAGVVEEGAADQPAVPSAESLLEGVTPFGDTALHVLAKSGTTLLLVFPFMFGIFLLVWMLVRFALHTCSIIFLLKPIVVNKI
jgi:hypothetical protein